MILKSALITAAMAAGVLAATFTSPAHAGCDNRPGTPTDIAVDSRQGAINIRWRDTTRPGEGSCHDIEIKRTKDGDTSRSVAGGVCLTGGTAGSLLVGNLSFGEQFCVRLKARDHAGTQGCVSQNWSATVCGIATYPPLSTGGASAGGPQIKDVEPGIDRPGNDIPGGKFTPKTANYKECQTACKFNSKCDAWTYVNPGVQGATAVCYLKNPAPPPRPNNCCTSGGKLNDVR